MPRYPSIDILRGVAIILMIQVHFVENLSPRQPGSAWIYDISMVLGVLPASLFAFVSGLSYSLWTRKQLAVGVREKVITKVTLRRGVFLFVIGIIFNFALWLPEETFNWDILTLLGTALLFLAVARHLPLPVLVLICVMVLLASPPLRVVGDCYSYWVDYAYTYDFTFRDIAFGFVSNGYFPVFPWIIFPIAGFVVGEVLFRPKPGSASRWLLTCGVVFLVVAVLSDRFGARFPNLLSRYYAYGFSEFPSSTEHVLGTLGGCFISLVLLHRWVDRTEDASREGGFIALMKRYSAFSLSIYVLHHMVMLWPLWIYAAWQGHDDSTIYWRKAMPTPIAFALAVVCVVACYFVVLFWENHKRWSLEWLMRRMCDHPIEVSREPPPK